MLAKEYLVYLEVISMKREYRLIYQFSITYTVCLPRWLICLVLCGDKHQNLDSHEEFKIPGHRMNFAIFNVSYGLLQRYISIIQYLMSMKHIERAR